MDFTGSNTVCLMGITLLQQHNKGIGGGADRSTKSITKLDIPTNGNISFDGENIFYKNRQSVLTRYNVSRGETTLYENIIAHDFCMDEQSIYYVSRTDGGGVYSCDKDGNNKKLISNMPAMSVTCDADNIYVLAGESGKEISDESFIHL